MAQKVNNKNYGASDTRGNNVYVCVPGELLRGGWRTVKGHIVDVKASEHQRTDSGFVGSVFLPFTHKTYKLISPQPPKDLQKHHGSLFLLAAKEKYLELTCKFSVRSRGIQ